MGEGVFYGPSVWPHIFALFPLASRKANVNNLSVSAFAIRLPAPACHKICQRCTVMISIRVFVCITVIKTFNVYVDHNSNRVSELIQGLNNVRWLAFQADPVVS